MKTKSKFLKFSVIALLLTLSTSLLAQTGPTAPTPATLIATAANLNIGRINDDETAVVTDAAAVFFLNPATGGTSVDLVASATDDSTPALTFDYYAWYLVDQDGTELGGSLGSDQTLTRSGSNLAPGFHRFRVYGFVGDVAGVNCESEQFQDIILFVLNPLQPTASNVDAITEFCIGDTGTFELDVAVTFELPYQNADFPNPAVEDFELTYRWYAVLDGDATNAIPLTSANTTISGGAANATIDYDALLDAGTYTFYVEVEYSSDIKDKGTRAEGHGFWRTDVLNGATAYEIVVTPRPGRPTITIGSVTD